MTNTPTTSPPLKDRFYIYRETVLHQKKADADFDEIYWLMKSTGPWIPVTLEAGYTGDAQVRQIGANIQFRGKITAPAAITTTSTLLGSFSPAPIYSNLVPGACSGGTDANSCSINFSTAGQIYVQLNSSGPATQKIIYLDGITINLD